MRLLLVEDDTKLVRALTLGLEREGYVVDAAESGDLAMELARATDYEGIVLDLMLPGIDGFTVCRQLRSEGRWMPVLMLTARTDVTDRIRGLDAGADDYLVKPFDFGELLARLRALLRRGPIERPPTMAIGDLRIAMVGGRSIGPRRSSARSRARSSPKSNGLTLSLIHI